MSILKPPRRSQRVEPLKDSDYDHEINLLDHSPPVSPQQSQEAEVPRRSTSRPSVEAQSSADRRARTPDRMTSPRAGPSRFDTSSNSGHAQDVEASALEVEQPTPVAEGTHSTAPTKVRKPRHETTESAIDILYENQRGGFLCGVSLFASKALGNLDPPPWTNAAHKPSPTDITNAQPPDPSWEWAWPEWRVNHEEGTDEDGWEYSFAFHKSFSWHGPTWWNSFVRRRAWIRKRVKKDSGYVQEDPGMLNAHYFAVRPASAAGHARRLSRASSRRGSKASISNSQTAELEEVEHTDIHDIDTLLRNLRASRIDREKIEATDNYLEHAGDDFAGLEGKMHEIMSLFVFQASRRVLLTRLARIHDQTLKSIAGAGNSEQLRQRAEHLTSAVRHADEEVRRLEYWSDTKGTVDHSQGWDERWRGLDTSGPAEPAAPGSGPL